MSVSVCVCNMCQTTFGWGGGGGGGHSESVGNSGLLKTIKQSGVCVCVCVLRSQVGGTISLAPLPPPHTHGSNDPVYVIWKNALLIIKQKKKKKKKKNV